MWLRVRVCEGCVGAAKGRSEALAPYPETSTQEPTGLHLTLRSARGGDVNLRLGFFGLGLQGLVGIDRPGVEARANKAARHAVLPPWPRC